MALPGLAASIVTPSDVISFEGASSTKVVDRDAADGLIRWITPGGWMAAAGSLVVVEAVGSGTRDSLPLRAYQLTSGQLAWASLPGSIPASLTSVPGGVLAELGVFGPAACTGPPGVGV